MRTTPSLFLEQMIKRPLTDTPEITYLVFELILSNQKKTSGIVFRGKNTSQTCYRDVTLKKIRIKSNGDKTAKVRFNSIG